MKRKNKILQEHPWQQQYLHEGVSATRASDPEESLQYAKETVERERIVNSIHDPMIRNSVSADIDDPLIYGTRDAFFLFAFRIPGINMSIPNLIMHLWELFIIIILMFSLINVWIPSSPYFWVPLSIWIATIVYFVLLIICILTLPSPRVAFTSSRARIAIYQRNDALHLWWGVLLHFFVSVFYLIWYTVPAGGVLPVDPLTNLVVYLGQTALHIILVSGCMAILFTTPFSNNLALTGRLLYRNIPPGSYSELEEIEYNPDLEDEETVYIKPASSMKLVASTKKQQQQYRNGTLVYGHLDPHNNNYNNNKQKPHYHGSIFGK